MQDKVPMIPTIRTMDLKSAMEWLCRAFGFEKHRVLEGENGLIEHAQRTPGKATILLGPLHDDACGKYFTTPGKIGGLNTQAPYLVPEYIDDHDQRAVSEDAGIVIERKNAGNGQRGATCGDPEGYILNTGSCNPRENEQD